LPKKQLETPHLIIHTEPVAMPPPPSHSAYTEGSGEFDPAAFFKSWKESSTPQNNDLRTAINKAFNLRPEDDYVYHANASVTLTQVQVAIDHGDVNGLHAWYKDQEGQQVQLSRSL
jgi:hypothetical protein